MFSLMRNRHEHYLGPQLFVSGSEMGLQLLLHILQGLAVDRLQSCQSSRDALWPGAHTLHDLNQSYACTPIHSHDGQTHMLQCLGSNSHDASISCVCVC